jgi:hypothetical protein
MHFDQIKQNMVLTHIVGDELFIVKHVGKDHVTVVSALGGRDMHIEPDHPFLAVVTPAGLVA